MTFCRMSRALLEVVVPHAVDDHRMQGDHGGLEPGRAADIAFANKAAADYQAEAATAVFLALIVVQIELDLGVFELADGFVEILGIPSPENVPAHQPAQFPVAQGNGVRVGLAFQVTTVDKRRVKNRSGSVSAKDMKAIEQSVRLVLGL